MHVEMIGIDLSCLTACAGLLRELLNRPTHEPRSNYSSGPFIQSCVSTQESNRTLTPVRSLVHIDHQHLHHHRRRLPLEKRNHRLGQYGVLLIPSQLGEKKTDLSPPGNSVVRVEIHIQSLHF
jgi:hypothetical protein